MKIIQYKYKDPEKSWFNKIFKKKKSRWSNERFNNILKFVDAHVDYSKAMCVTMTPDLFTIFSVLSREPQDLKSPGHYLMQQIKEFKLFQAMPGSPQIPALLDPYVALTTDTCNEICSHIMFKYNDGDIVFITFEKLKLFKNMSGTTWEG